MLTRLGAVLAKDAPVLEPGADALSRMGSAMHNAADLNRNIRSELDAANIQIPPRIEIDSEHLSRAAANPDTLLRSGETLSRLAAIAAQDAPDLAPGAEVLGHLGATLAGAGRLGSDIREVVGVDAGDPLRVGNALGRLGSFLSGAVRHRSEPAHETQIAPTPPPPETSEQAQPQPLRSDRMPDGARAPRATRISLPVSAHDRELPSLPTPARTAARRRPDSDVISGMDIPGSDEFARVPLRALSISSEGRPPATSEGDHSSGAHAVDIAHEQPDQGTQTRTGRTRDMGERNGRHSRAGSSSAARPRPAPAFGAGGGGGGGPPNPDAAVDRYFNEKREVSFSSTAYAIRC